MAQTTIIFNFPNNPNETVIQTDVEPPLPRVVIINEASDLSEEQIKAILDARAALIEQIRACLP